MMYTRNKILAVLILLVFSTAISARVRSGLLTVISNPTDAKVWVDGHLEGTTPLKGKVFEEGMHTVRVMDEINQISQTKTVEVIADSLIILDIALEREFGGINVTTQPEGAEVVFTTSLGKTPLKENNILPGAYTVNISMPNGKYGSIQKEVIVSPNATIEINETLPKIGRKTAPQIILRAGLGVAAIGCYIWGFDSMADDNVTPANIGFGIGTAFVIGLTTVSILF